MFVKQHQYTKRVMKVIDIQESNEDIWLDQRLIKMNLREIDLKILLKYRYFHIYRVYK